MSKSVSVFGANGETGRRLIPLLLKEGNTVICNVRRPETMNDLAGLPNLSIRPCDVSKPATVRGALQHPTTGDIVDVIVSVVGGPVTQDCFGLPKAIPTTVYTETAAAVVQELIRLSAALPVANINSPRFLIVTANFKDPNTPFFYRKILKPRLMNLYKNMEAAEQEIVLACNKNLNLFSYTFVRAVYIHDRWKHGGDAVGKSSLMRGDKWWCHYDDFALFLVHEIDSQSSPWINSHVIPIEK